MGMFSRLAKKVRSRATDLRFSSSIIGRMAQGPGILRDVENRWIGRGVGQRRHGNIDEFDAELDRFEGAERP